MFGHVVQIAIHQSLKGVHCLFYGGEDAGHSREDLGHEHGLRKEPLDFAGAGDRYSVFFGKLVKPQDGDDVLKLFVSLQDFLDAAGDIVVPLPHYLGGEDCGGGRQGIHRRVDAEGGDVAGQLGGAVKVGEGGEGGRIGVVVGGHIHGLQGGDGAASGGGDALLKLAHLVGEGGLVADSGRHTAQQGGDFGAGLDEAEDVVYEQQHILVLDIAEILGDGHAS